MAQDWDRIVDVVIVGSGGAALVAATLAADQGAETLVVEKDELLGGTTAVSGGGIWLPNNHVMAEAGVADSREAVLAYLDRVVAGRAPDPALIEVFVDTAPEMLRYLTDNTPCSFHIQPLPDYYWPWHFPGTLMQPGRTVEANPYPVGEKLPEWKDRIVKRGTLMSLGAATTLSEDFAPRTPELEAELARREAQDVRPKGAALIAALLEGLLDRNVDIWLSSPAKELVMDESGESVIGVVVDHDGTRERVGTRKGIVLACGGFEWNRDMVMTHIGYDVKPLSPGGNTGDGLQMAMRAGAQLGNTTSYWGTPVMFDPEITRNGEMVPQFEWGRGEPSSFIVNQDGVRFANEALPYNDFPKAFGVFDQDEQRFPNAGPCWQIFDAKVRAATRVLSMLPGEPDPGWVIKADTIEDLAAMIDIDPATLRATFDEFNANAAERIDPLFDRHAKGLMAPGAVKPLDAAPYYAVRIWPGMLGTNGGPAITKDAQVKRQGGGVIDGLYAAGNTAANVFGWSYPSGGGTIGNGTVFGYRAGIHAGSRPARDI